MNCKCIEERREQIKNNIAESNEEFKGLEITSVECDNSCYLFESGKLSMYINFTVNHVPVGRKRKKEVKMLAKFCPFCGEKINKEDGE